MAASRKTFVPILPCQRCIIMSAVTWFYRAIERPDGQWACRHGRLEYDDHSTVDAALQHLEELAPSEESIALYVHPLRGRPHQVR